MIKKILYTIGALLILSVVTVSIFIFYVFGWEERAITDNLNTIPLVTKNLGQITTVTLIDNNKNNTSRDVTINIEGENGNGVLSGVIKPTENESEYQFNGNLNLQNNTHQIMFIYSGVTKYKGKIQHKKGRLKVTNEKVL